MYHNVNEVMTHRIEIDVGSNKKMLLFFPDKKNLSQLTTQVDWIVAIFSAHPMGVQTQTNSFITLSVKSVSQYPSVFV